MMCIDNEESDVLVIYAKHSLFATNHHLTERSNSLNKKLHDLWEFLSFGLNSLSPIRSAFQRSRDLRKRPSCQDLCQQPHAQ